VDSREGCFPPSSFALASSGIFLTGFGSSYYHWSPNDGTLFWDRLPMALVASTVEERVNTKAGAVLLWPLFAIGVFSHCCGAGVAICGSMAGCNFFRASHCR
jgi:hypothetical protein